MGKEYVAKVGRGSKSLSNFVLAGYGLRILPNFSVTVRPPSISKVKEDEINEIMKMIHSLDEIRDDYIYCSTPITSGPRYYILLKEYGVRNGNELPREVLFDEVIKPNLEEAKAFAEETKLKYGKPVINPAQFEAKELKWEERDYLRLWWKVIGNLVRKVVFNKGWAYSAGCIVEYIIQEELRWIRPMFGPTERDDNFALWRGRAEYEARRALLDVANHGLDYSNLLDLFKELLLSRDIPPPPDPKDIDKFAEKIRKMYPL